MLPTASVLSMKTSARVLICRPCPWNSVAPLASRTSPRLLLKVLSVIETVPTASIWAPNRRLSLASTLLRATFAPPVMNSPVSSIKPGLSVVLALKTLFEMKISPPASRLAPHRKLSLPVTSAITITSGVTTCKP